ncbi:BTAD domain-containing putative transcriptional regulator [Nocardia sp. CDC153]|uniref:AfsR/SARP family transcriptional regulator n=1 Tax=Nocardia sp. CDC153 TaxID=3112167 RepID=UPI002DB8A91A|nr:BTAD domain-containing putative transcriptional regulator [Nocardia sp. CDC153]MEC3952005.1 BTAD domain-containing putative transcriptional regulator [Nocardia sp. CDC153]
MKIRILGPFQVTTSTGADITPSAPKLRAVLALLALNADTVVRIDQLMSELWEDNPPRSASTTLQTYIYQLRKLLRNTSQSDDFLETTQTGYILRIPTDTLDAKIFEDRVAAGREHLNAGNLNHAAAGLAAALEMWRGPMLGAASMGPILQAETVRLEELRKTALEQRFDADLELGRHRQLIGELAALVAENPMDEGIRYRQMLAMYRSGRRVEALTSYQQLRTVLSEELGLEPCMELQKLHLCILGEDPVLDYVESSNAGRMGTLLGVRPRQLPPDVALVGRDAQIREVERIFGTRDSGSVVVEISGAPGAGKTSLAIRAGHAVKDDFPDGQLWAELCTADGELVTAGEVLGDFLRAAGFADSRIPNDTNMRARMFRSWTATNRVLIVLDDVVRADQVLPLLPGGTGSGVIVVSRRVLGLRPTGVVRATPLTRRASSRMLANLLGADRIGDDIAAATRIIESCEGNAAVLQAICDTLLQRPHWPLDRVLEEATLDTVPGHFSPTRQPGREVLLKILGRTHDLLSAAAQSAFHTLVVLDGPVSKLMAAQMLCATNDYAEAVLEELVEFHLFDVTPTVGEFMYELAGMFRGAATALVGMQEIPRAG